MIDDLNEKHLRMFAYHAANTIASYAMDHPDQFIIGMTKVLSKEHANRSLLGYAAYTEQLSNDDRKRVTYNNFQQAIATVEHFADIHDDFYKYLVCSLPLFQITLANNP